MTRPLAAVPHLWNADFATLTAWHARITDLLAAALADDVVRTVAPYFQKGRGEKKGAFDSVKVEVDPDDGFVSIGASFLLKGEPVAREDEDELSGRLDSMVYSSRYSGGDLVFMAKRWQPLDHLTCHTRPDAVGRCLAQWPEVRPEEQWVKEDSGPKRCDFDPIHHARTTLMVLQFNQILARIPEGMDMRVINMSASVGEIESIVWSFGTGGIVRAGRGYTLQGPSTLLEDIEPLIAPWTATALSPSWSQFTAEFIAVVSGHALGHFLACYSPGTAPEPALPWTRRDHDRCLPALLTRFAPQSAAQWSDWCLRQGVPGVHADQAQPLLRPRM